MKSMDDKQFKTMMKAASVFQGGVRIVQRIRTMLLSHAALVVAVAVILIAVLLRWLGIM